MASKKPPTKSSEKPDALRRKRPPATIDLSATEVHVEPAQAEAENPAASSSEESPPSNESATGDVAGANDAAADAGEQQAHAPENLPDVIEPVPRATFYEKPADSETVDAQQSRSWQSGPAFTQEAPPVQPPPPPPPPRFPWAVASAAACGGALIVFLALFFAGALQMQPTQKADDAAAAGAQANAALVSANAELSARLAKLESALANLPAAPATDPALTSRLSSLETAVKSIGDNASSTANRGSDVADAVREAREKSEANARALAELKSTVDQLNGNAAAKSDLEKVTDRVSAVESSTRTVEEKIETPGSTAADRDVRIAVLASSLKATVERGSPFTVELEAIKPLVSDPKAIEALAPFASTGLPSAPAVIAEFAALIPALNDAAAPSSHTGGVLDRLQGAANRLVRVRPVNEAPGTDPASVIDRAEAKSLRGDIPGIVKELSSLPANIRAPADGWIAKANARGAALAAVQQISADALNALAKPAH